MKFTFLSHVAALALFAISPAAAEESVTIGGEKLVVPVPAGFTRLDGINKEFDENFAKFMPPSNRVLMVFATGPDIEKAKAGEGFDMKRYFVLQTLRAGESKTFTLKEFESIAAGVEAQIGPKGDGLSKAQKETDARIKAVKLPMELKVGEMRSLGIFDKTDRSLDFGMMSAVQIGNEKPETMINAASIALIRGKVVYLYVYAARQDDADLPWVRDKVKSWRESMLAANPGGTPKGGFDFGSIGNNALIGAVVGGLAGLIAVLVRKKRQG